MSRVSSLVVAFSALLLGTVVPVSAQQIHLPPSVSQSQGMGGVPVTAGYRRPKTAGPCRQPAAPARNPARHRQDGRAHAGTERLSLEIRPGRHVRRRHQESRADRETRPQREVENEAVVLDVATGCRPLKCGDSRPRLSVRAQARTEFRHTLQSKTPSGNAGWRLNVYDQAF